MALTVSLGVHTRSCIHILNTLNVLQRRYSCMYTPDVAKKGKVGGKR